MSVGALVAGLVGAQRSRIEVIPDGDEHPRWGEVLELLDRLEIRLDPWQLRVLWASLLRRGAMWAAFAVAVCAPRQNGKNGILEPRELAGALVLGERLIIHSAHLADTSKEAFRRIDELIDSNAWLSSQVKHIWRTNGHEAIEFVNGSRIRYRTRTRGGGRGFSGSPVIFDEPMFLPEVSMGSILPVMSAQPDPQAWYTGSAVDQMIHEDGVVFARVRERALAGTDDRLAYFEWSVDAETPDEVVDAVAADPATWAACNPALGIRIQPEYVAAERRELDPRTFAVERLGVGDWPATDAASSVIDPRKWGPLADDRSRIQDPVCLAFSVTPKRDWGTIAAAGRRSDGLAGVEVIDRREGTGWIIGRLVELDRSHQPTMIVCDSQDAAASLIPEIQQQGVRVKVLTTGEYKQACGIFFDSVDQATLRHRGTRELDAAVKMAGTRRVGDAWVWSRKDSKGDISPLVSCTGALWGISVAPSSVYEERGMLVLGR